MRFSYTGDLQTDLAAAQQLISAGRGAEAEGLLRVILSYAPSSRDAARLLAIAAIRPRSGLPIPRLSAGKQLLLVPAIYVGVTGAINAASCIASFVQAGGHATIQYQPMSLLRKYSFATERVEVWTAFGWAALYVAIAVALALVALYPFPWRRRM